MTDIFPGATLIQLKGWGYPMGSLRPIPRTDQAFSVIHITANLATAEGEVTWRLTEPERKNSATFFVNPDGSVIQALGDPLHMDPWTNGLIQNPDMTNPRIASVVRDGVNPNERSLVTIENVGLEPANPITPAQVATNGRILAYYHARIGIPVNRETVIGHYQITGIDRPNCPSTDKSVIDKIIASAGGETGETEMNITTKIYPWPRTWFTKGGNLTGYALSDAPNLTVGFGVGSPAPSSAEVSISPLPTEWGWPAGPYQLVSDGPLMGLLVANSQVTLGVEPAPLLGPPSDGSADCSTIEAELAASKVALTTSQTALFASQTALATSKTSLAEAQATIKAAASGIQGLLEG